MALSDGEQAVLLQDILARLPEKPMTETSIKALVDQSVRAYMDANPEVARKLTFNGGAPQLKGSKFSRYNLGIGDVEFLYDLMSATSHGPSTELSNAFKAMSDAVYMTEAEVKEIDRQALDGLFPRIPKGGYAGRDQELVAKGLWWLTDAYKVATKAMDTAESGFGSQIVGQQYVSELWEAARVQSRLFGLIPTFEMTAPTAFLPIMQAFPELLFVSESTGANATAYATSKTGSNRVQVDAKKFVVHQQWSGEMEEDSIIPFVPFLRMELQNALAHYSDSAVLNGDTVTAATGNINLDDAAPGATRHYLAFDGIRKAGIVNNTANSKDIAGGITATELLLAKGRMLDTTEGKYFYWGFPNDPNDVVYAMDVETALRVTDLDEVVTLDKFGPQASILRGQLGAIWGHPILATPAMSKTEADGKVSTTASLNTKGQIATFNRRGFVVGWRRRIRLETERLPRADQTAIVASLRLGFGRYGHAATALEAADVIYNITV